MNIYVTDDLRERMRPYDRYVSWSEVAALAFETEIMRQQRRLEALKQPRRKRRMRLMEDMQ